MLQYEKLFRRIQCLSDEKVFIIIIKNKSREINIFASLRISADNRNSVVMQQMENIYNIFKGNCNAEGCIKDVFYRDNI